MINKVIKCFIIVGFRAKTIQKQKFIILRIKKCFGFNKNKLKVNLHVYWLEYSFSFSYIKTENNNILVISVFHKKRTHHTFLITYTNNLIIISLNNK